MSRSRQFSVSALFVCFGWMLAGACSSGSSGDGAGPPSAGTGGHGGVGGSAGTGGRMVVQSGSSNGGSPDNTNPLCGAGTCVPDKTDACKEYMPPMPIAASGANAGGEAAGGLGGVSSDGGMSGGGAQVGGALNGPGGGPSAGGAQGGDNHGGESSLGGSGGAAAAGAAGANNPAGLAQYSCQVGRERDADPIIRQCVLAGTGAANAPCFSAADCAPSLACVKDGDAGRCLPYCCKPDTACTSGSYCAERPLIKEATDTSKAAPPGVPVCVPADNCSLEDLFPCPADGQCRCQGDLACMVVRDDGTTTCLKPGKGQEGEPCTPPGAAQAADPGPCAWNHVCSSVTHQCVKICSTDPTKSDCGAQKCQASSELPPNFGVCVGPLK